MPHRDEPTTRWCLRFHRGENIRIVGPVLEFARFAKGGEGKRVGIVAIAAGPALLPSNC